VVSGPPLVKPVLVRPRRNGADDSDLLMRAPEALDAGQAYPLICCVMMRQQLPEG
jgi:hypothetical protein